jgi:hypothetical protein
VEKTAIERHFSDGEVERLQRSLPRLARWSGALLVPFKAHRLQSAAIAWINRRWFLERGFDLGQVVVLRRLTAWLLDEFAWCVQTSSTSFTADARTLWADRYGSSDGFAVHGGSGRVATVGCFQAKGVGQTPLVGQGAPPGHSHGYIALAECLREAIFAEIAAAEFPHGAIPVVAVLDTGLYFSSPNPADRYDQNVRRGILVRPAVFRPAHAERAPLFKHPIGDFINKQSDDVQRTRDVIAHWTASASSRKDAAADAETLTTWIRAIGEQIAFGQVHRLFSGGYFSSNVSIHGELLDLANMHALPNWSRAQVHSVVAGLGDEVKVLRAPIGALAFYFTKYQRRGYAGALAQHLLESATSQYELAWRRYSLALCQAEGLPPDAQDLLHGIFREYFSQQQRHRVKYRFGVPAPQGSLPAAGWLYEALVSEGFVNDQGERRVLSRAAAQLRRSRADLYVPLSTAVRLLMPRVGIDRRRLLEMLAAAVPRRGRSLDSKTLDVVVRETVSGARRHWAHLPSGYAVLAHTVCEGSSALLCAQQPKGPRTVWLEGIVGSPASLHWFDSRFEASDFGCLQLRQAGAHWSVMCDAREAEGGVWHACLPCGEVALPPLDVSYAMPARRWMEVGSAQIR